MRRPFALRAEIVQHLRESGAEELRARGGSRRRARSADSPASTSQFARSSRVARRPPVSSLPRKPGTAGCTIAPESSIQLPRARMRVSAGVTASDTITRGIAVSSSAAACSQLRRVRHFGLRFRRRPLEVRRDRGLLCGGALLFRHAQRAQHGVRNLFALVGRRPREFARRERQAEAADGGAAEFGILLDAHGQHGVGGGLQRLREAQREKRLGGLVVRVDRPAGLRIAVDRAAPADTPVPGCSGWTCP